MNVEADVETQSWSERKIRNNDAVNEKGEENGK